MLIKRVWTGLQVKEFEIECGKGQKGDGRKGMRSLQLVVDMLSGITEVVSVKKEGYDVISK